MAHGHLRRSDQLDAAYARSVADAMHALATPSRVQILGRLRNGPASVNEIAAAIDMTPSAVSQQLRVLRHLRFVTGQRDGRRVLYDLHDDHVTELLDAVIGHIEHVQLGLHRSAANATTVADAAQRP